MSRTPVRSRRRALASVLTGARSASAAAVGGVVAPASAAEGDVTGATLSWGVKESFRNYITGSIAHGSVTTTGGVANNGSSYGWSGGTGVVDDAVPSADVSYAGGVHFTGHGGQLDMLLENVRVDLEGGSGTLYADVKSKALSGSDYDVDGVAFATLTPGAPSVSNGVATWTNVPAALTADGAVAFASFYGAGTALDPVSFSLP